VCETSFLPTRWSIQFRERLKKRGETKIPPYFCSYKCVGKYGRNKQLSIPQDDTNQLINYCYQAPIDRQKEATNPQ